MRCTVADSLDEDFYTTVVKEVYERIGPDLESELRFVVVEDEEDCEKIVSESDTEEGLLEVCEESGSSSFSVSDKSYVLIVTEDRFSKDNLKALEGLIAHELMHSVQREEGLEDEIEDVAVSFSDTVVRELEERGVSPEDSVDFISDVMGTMIFCLKDLYVNTELVEAGFSEELASYYRLILDTEGLVSAPEIYSNDENLGEVEEALKFVLEFLPAWIPFRRDDARGGDIEESIRQGYEANIPLTSDSINRISELYLEEFGRSEEFMNKFFEKLLSLSYRVMDDKLD
ncbi:MAG: hypothetical protein MUP58_03370 [Candidatus Nanohaloarchaeota archaeon QJJ-9]|nr:hypothetical protein [Candidatus Nanohaloarchaeota archaeon QJJ-9]